MVELGRVGIWSVELRVGEPAEVEDAARELEELGYGAIWVPGREPDDLEERLRALLRATATIPVATGIVGIWTHDAEAMAAMHARLRRDFPGRFLLGIGVSHAPLVEQYRRPLWAMAEYLDHLDRAEHPVPREERVIAALAPKMLELARERSRGSHTYLVPPAHTHYARRILGVGALLAPELTVVLEADPTRARSTARAMLARYLQLPNYVNNLLRSGFAAEDVEAGGSDRLVDELVAWGEPERIRGAIDRHRTAGADHVALQVLGGDGLPREQWRRLAAVLDRRGAQE
jgi:probable F420-dependent oxidoreductase